MRFGDLLIAWKLLEPLFNLQDKLDHRFSHEILRFVENLGLPIFDENCPEPGLGSARIGFLAKNYVG